MSPAIEANRVANFMSDTGRHCTDRSHLLLLAHLMLQQTELRNIIEAPDIPGCVLLVDHDGETENRRLIGTLLPVCGGISKRPESIFSSIPGNTFQIVMVKA